MTDNFPLPEFSIKHFPRYNIHILKDNVTGVEYIITIVSDNHCVTPRLHSDGSLYCGLNSQKEASE